MIKPYYETSRGKLYLGCCLDILPEIEQASIDMILCDLPYGTTSCIWDTIIPFESLWLEYKRITKDNSAIVLTASQPFTSKLVMSNLDMFKYEWIWDKKKPSGFQLAKYRPMIKHENVLVFCKETPNYYPIKTIRNITKVNGFQSKSQSSPLSKHDGQKRIYDDYLPKSIIEISNADQHDRVHPTQKPIKFFNYLIRTYTNENDLVLDNCSGSGTTAIACEDLNRRWICIEKEERYCQLSATRIENFLKQGKLF